MKWLVLLSLIAANVVQLPSPLVRTRSGLVRGRVGESGKFHQFLGIPYGMVDETNRFQAPLPPPRWEGILDAVNENTWCPQRHGSAVIGTPDCLKLNVYVPTRATPDSRLPVMVFIHGGCFFEGISSPFLYGGDYFPEHGVVFIAINYRLNVEGFLCLGIKEAPGNAGLKDQIAALKWIQQNVRAFGGDPDNVTLFGESAGAVSTSFLILSPAAKGLFHKVILQSGSSLAPWGIQHNPIKTASNLVKNLGYNTNDPREIYKIISEKSFDELIKAIKYSRNKNWITAEILFVPCVENEIAGVEPIVTEFPVKIIQSGNYTKVPMIIGLNDKEGLFFVSRDYGTSLKDVDTTQILQPDLVFPNEGMRNQTLERIQRHYFSSGEDELIMDMVNLYSDIHFKYPSVVESKMYTRTTDQPIFFYLFKYSGLMNFPKFISWFGGKSGASHADEMFYMFRPHAFPTAPLKSLETVMMTRLLTLWTNFAKFSDPTPKTSRLLPIKWRPSREWNPRALVIDRAFTTAPMWHEPTVALWNHTYSQFRRRTYGFKHINLGLTRTCCGTERIVCNKTN